PPEEIHQRAMRVFFSVGMLVMFAVQRHELPRRFLQTANAEYRRRVFEPQRAFETAMRQQSMKAEVHAQRAEHIEARHTKRRTGPTEQPRHEGGTRQRMDAGD